MLHATEVSDEGSDWLLSAELRMFELASAKTHPQVPLGIRLVPPQVARSITQWNGRTLVLHLTALTLALSQGERG
jgi:hypothetical protein